MLLLRLTGVSREEENVFKTVEYILLIVRGRNPSYVLVSKPALFSKHSETGSIRDVQFRVESFAMKLAEILRAYIHARKSLL